MRFFAGIVLASVMILVVTAKAPEAPRLGESFTSEALISFDGIVGSGLWAVDQSTIKFTFANESQPQFYEVSQYDQATNFVISGAGQDCVARPLGPAMPIAWLWLKFAKFVGVQTIDEIDYNCWVEETAYSLRHLAVPVQGGMDSAILTLRNVSLAASPAVTASVPAGSLIVLRFTSFIEGAAPESAPSAVFAVPEQCPPALPVALTADELAEMLPAENNRTVGLLGDLQGVLNKAKEICTCGCPYVWGGNGPCCYGQPSGYDCSGMTMRSYNVGGYSLPRVAADQQKAGRACSGAEQAGDLLFFGKPAYHVVMYIGGGSIAECPRTGLNCRITAKRAYDGGCRRIA